MPIYEYVCLDCRKKFEVLRAMRDADAPIQCAACNSEHTSRCLTVFYAQSGGKVVAGSQPSCSGCTAGTCSSCRN